MFFTSIMFVQLAYRMNTQSLHHFGNPFVFEIFHILCTNNHFCHYYNITRKTDARICLSKIFWHRLCCLPVHLLLNCYCCYCFFLNLNLMQNPALTLNLNTLPVLRQNPRHLTEFFVRSLHHQLLVAVLNQRRIESGFFPRSQIENTKQNREKMT